MYALLALLITASAAETTQELVWDITWKGKAVGTRTLTVKYVQEERGSRRILQGETEIDGRAAGFDYTWKQRFTAHAQGRAPASFTSAVLDNGEPREVQGRVNAGVWTITLVDGGQARTWTLPLAEIQLSSADLFDPESFVSLAKFDAVHILSAETGDVWQQSVERLPPTEIAIDGLQIAVQGIAVDPPQGRAEYWYTGEGILVRSTYSFMGRELQLLLRDPPPEGVDDVPVSTTSVIGEMEL